MTLDSESRGFVELFFVIIIIIVPYVFSTSLGFIPIVATCWSLKLWRQFSNALSLLSVLFPNLCSTCKEKKERAREGAHLEGIEAKWEQGCSGNLADSYLFFASA